MLLHVWTAYLLDSSLGTWPTKAFGLQFRRSLQNCDLEILPTALKFSNNDDLMTASHCQVVTGIRLLGEMHRTINKRRHCKWISIFLNCYQIRSKRFFTNTKSALENKLKKHKRSDYEFWRSNFDTDWGLFSRFQKKYKEEEIINLKLIKNENIEKLTKMIKKKDEKNIKIQKWTDKKIMKKIKTLKLITKKDSKKC